MKIKSKLLMHLISFTQDSGLGTIGMGNDGIDKLNGNDRRKGAERRKAERRDSNRQAQESVLTTRAGERRQKPRRAADQKSGKKSGKGDGK